MRACMLSCLCVCVTIDCYVDIHLYVYIIGLVKRGVLTLVGQSGRSHAVAKSALVIVIATFLSPAMTHCVKSKIIPW